MTFTVSPWLVWAGASLALFGVWFLCEKAWQAGRDWWCDRPRIMWIRDWWYDLRRDRVTPLLEPEGTGVLCAGCAGFDHCDGREGACDCTCGWSQDWAEKPLPPERTWEQMTAHQLPVVGMSAAERKHWHKLERARKGRARRVEMTHRAHYAAMGYEFPSGLMARVRELTP